MRPRSGTAAAPRQHKPSDRPLAACVALPQDHVALIDRSHERCAALGLSRIERPDHMPLGRADLTVVRDRHRRLLDHAAPVMDLLFEQISGTQSIVLLCDATGTVLHSIGDDDFLARASKVALQPGVDWSEHAKGTNAIGTALIEETPTLVHADEHFMHANQFLTCSAAPILDPRGNMLGVLDVTGDYRGYHQHTMALVRISARMIENHWLSDDRQPRLRLHFHARRELIGTLMEGLLAVAPDGRIAGANRSALEQLDLSGAALRLHSVESLFGISPGTLVDRFRDASTPPQSVFTADGRRFHVQARFNHHRPAHLPDAAPTVAARSTGSRPLPRNALESLCADPHLAGEVKRLRQVMDQPVPVTVVGDGGTGKQWLARALHAASARTHRPFVAVDVIDTDWAANAASVQRSRGGTLFLRGLDRLPSAGQAAWLRMLEAGQDEGQRPLYIVCASRVPLQALVVSGRLDPDLAAALGGLTVTLPPLRERQDLAVLAERLLAGDGLPPSTRLLPTTLALLQAHDWPGNVRELRGVLTAAAALAGADRPVQPQHLPEHLRQAPRPGPIEEPGTISTLDTQQREAIERALQAADGNVSEAARRLGVSRNTIYRKLRHYGAG